jgi:nitroreductase
VLEIISKTRSFRRFDQNRTIPETTLESLVNLARLGGSARNCQPWQYSLINDQSRCAEIFPYIGWAGYLSDWKGPVEGERPTAYILCLLNRHWLIGSDKEAQFDLGVSTQNLLLGAMHEGMGGCRIGAFSPKLTGLFDIPDNLELSLVIALGYPAETVVLEDTDADGSIKYYRDAQDIHHVPKRTLAELIVKL